MVKIGQISAKSSNSTTFKFVTNPKITKKNWVQLLEISRFDSWSKILWYAKYVPDKVIKTRGIMPKRQAWKTSRRSIFTLNAGHL
ncbi:unnamed protein product [Blepharisma stoltei]|uniref:Uncharacterized protein n=1 Tax=Blepharisma stoltei TaxID=1481888 RepID=A0AAU9KRF0_9CILI|nr:unnamed protein product [Blepharisma stoltei]